MNVSEQTRLTAMRCEAHRLAPLLSVGELAVGAWTPTELAAILRHQLRAPLGSAPLKPQVAVSPGAEIESHVSCVGRPSSVVGQNPSRAGNGAVGEPSIDVGMRTFGDLFVSCHPPLATLVLVKEFAKAHLDGVQQLIPGEVAAVLYYSSIALARCRAGARISKLEDAQVLAGLRWTLAQAWVEEPLRSILADAELSLTAPGGVA